MGRGRIEGSGRNAASLKAPGFEPVAQLHAELASALRAAMPREMRRHRAGFDYLPMLMEEDKAWAARNERERPQPQIAQWALYARFIRVCCSRGRPRGRGHIALMQAATEGISRRDRLAAA